jgi:hypothetical protein
MVATAPGYFARTWAPARAGVTRLLIGAVLIFLTLLAFCAWPESVPDQQISSEVFP